MKPLSCFVPASRPCAIPSLTKDAPFPSPYYNHNIRGPAPNHLVPIRSLTFQTATLNPVPSIDLLRLAAAFLAGGLFCSTALAGVAAFLAFGEKNLEELFSMLSLMVSKVWSIFVFGLKETRLALRMDGKFQWNKAWQVLKEKLRETRQAAVEGVEAVKAQANFYAAAVGAPGLIPIQYVLDRMMPHSIGYQLEQSIREALKEIKNSNVRKVELVSFDAGRNAPQLSASRVYDVENAMAFDMDMEWNSDMVVKLRLFTRLLGFKVPVSVKKVSFKGVIRLEMAPLRPEPPGYGALIISFPTVPDVNLDIKVAGGEISKVPWLRAEILSEVKKAIEEDLLWPKRLVVPSHNKALSREELEELKDRDPFRKAEIQLQEKPMLKDFLQKQNAHKPKSPLKVKFGVEAE